jgi:class 3 adenylate cyclase
MKCPRCQQENPAHARFCLGCGARLALACASCGTELPGGARFCLQCGQAVGTGTALPSRSPAPDTYTPKHLAERIINSKAALEGERKQVTVLFADLKGSMELLADRDPEEARKVLDPVLELMMEAVHRYEGTVNQVMGDGIMALFGAPLAREDHAVRACYAALRMQENVKRYADEVRRSHAAVVKIRVGLNSGEVVVRTIGSDLHMDYTAVGQTTHLAARMEQMEIPGSVLITPDTLALLGVVVASPERARQYFRHFPACFPIAAAPDRAIHRAYRLPEAAKTPAFVEETERRAAKILRDQGVKVEAGEARSVFMASNGFAITVEDQAELQRQNQTVGQFLIGRDGLIRWTYRPVDSSVAHCGGAIFTGLVTISYTFRRLGYESEALRHSYWRVEPRSRADRWLASARRGCSPRALCGPSLKENDHGRPQVPMLPLQRRERYETNSGRPRYGLSVPR